MTEIVIINPRYEISFWGLEHCMPIFGKRANLPVANLALLAALVPSSFPIFASTSPSRIAFVQGLIIAAILISALYVAREVLVPLAPSSANAGGAIFARIRDNQSAPEKTEP